MAMMQKWVKGVTTIGLFCVSLVMPVEMVTADQKPISVVASIKPIHSLVAAVMGDIGTPHLLLEAPTSAHHFTLKPSQARSLQAADIVFWVGPTMEQPLTKALATLAPQAQTLPLIESAGLLLINFDEVAPAHEKHDHEKHDHEKHDHEKHYHEKHDEHAKHDDHLINPHIWLDPQNAKIMLGVIAAHLAKADPENASTYAANADSMAARLATLETDITSQLASYSAAKFLVLHDAHVYFERRFGLRNYGAITTEPDVMPTASRVKALRDELREHRFDCIFTEPFLGQKAAALIAEGSKVSIGTLDPIASNLPAGAQLYPDLLMSYAKALRSCFGVH